MRRSFDGLESLVRERLGDDPTSGAWFVFWNRRRDRLKILSFDGSGLWIWYKRLEGGCFEVPGRADDGAEITSAELMLVLEGIEVTSVRHRRRWRRNAGLVERFSDRNRSFHGTTRSPAVAERSGPVAGGHPAAAGDGR
jgi:transposase